MLKSFDFDILRYSKNNDFIQELERSSKIITKGNAQQYFQTLVIRFNETPTNRITKAILSNIYEIISTHNEILDIFAQNNFFIFLPYSAKVYNREILNILYKVIERAPEKIIYGFEDKLKDLIQYECKKSLFLLYLYANHFETLEKDQTKILELLVDQKCSQRLSAYTTAIRYITLLSFVLDRSKSFREEHSGDVWKILYKILKENYSTEIIQTCYMTLAQIESYGKAGKIDFDLINTHLQNKEVQETVLHLLFYVRFEKQPIMKDETFISSLTKLSQKNGFAILILADLCNKSPNVADYLSQHIEWLKVDHRFVRNTMCLFLIVYQLRGDTMELGKEFAQFLINFCGSSDIKDIADQGTVIKVIATVIRKVQMNNTVLDELCNKKTFFQNLINLTIEKDKSIYYFNCALIADLIGQIGYRDELIDFCQIIARGVSMRSKSFDNICSVGIRLLKYPQVKDKFNELKIQDTLTEKTSDEKTRTMAQKFLKKLTKIKE